MKRRCLNANGKNPTYAQVELRMTQDEWLAWAIPRYEAFDREFPGESPNAGRQDDCGHYEIGNIRIIPHRQNRAEQGEACRAKNGIKRCSRCKQTKSTAAFGYKLASSDGLDYWCRQCKSEQWISYRSRSNGPGS